MSAQVKNNHLWVWGYVLDKVPGNAPFVNLPTFCSLETACDYLGADNAVYMNPMYPSDAFRDELLQRLENRKQVVCALENGNYLESAKTLASFAKHHPNITGAIIDDFLDRGYTYRGPSADMTPEDLKAVYGTLKDANPDFQLYVVRYTRLKPEELIPYLAYFDVLNLWVWTSTADYWNAEYHHQIQALRTMYDKPVMQGMFLHHYGLGYDHATPMNLELLETQCVRIGDQLMRNVIQDWCVLQSGWFCRHTHRKQVEMLREYFKWFYGTWTRR